MKRPQDSNARTIFGGYVSWRSSLVIAGNVAQNPLLGALQDPQQVEFEEIEPGSPFGMLKVTFEDYDQVPMIDLLRRLATRLEQRIPALNENVVKEERVAELLRLLQNEQVPSAKDDFTVESDDGAGSTYVEDDDDDEIATVMLSEETRLVDFYTEIKARIRVLELQGITDADEVSGLRRESLLGFIKPVVLVDGQHRLRGAVKSASEFAKRADGESHILDMVEDGKSPEAAEEQLMLEESRQLPFSLLMDESPSEHVFQFVVVNQKAVPMRKALLGTIVSTSLTREELQHVADRIQAAGIELEDSQAVAYLTRAADSPFCGLIQTGMSGDRVDLLKWSVLQGLVSIFRKLQGGRPYHAKVDYARAWRIEYFPECGLVSGDSVSEKFEEWSRPDGAWREVFIRFFTKVRDYFGDVDNPETFNGWGSTAHSNLFNKISLTILASDYFDFIYTQALTIDSLEDFDVTLDSWLKGGRVSSSYFNRDWHLERVKKDQLVVKRLWSQNWHEYRKVPANGLPRKYKP
ncbi:hypothetical protein [Actinomadura sp. 3N407]|uniref:hypothetical protein n=1 Tax=Actinomadura sp. 3N407 TaxID=3457423 RepID=UPI003FCDC41F